MLKESFFLKICLEVGREGLGILRGEWGQAKYYGAKIGVTLGKIVG